VKRLARWALFAAALAAVLVLIRVPANDEVAGIGKPAPELSARTIVSPAQPRRIAEYRGHVVLLNVWATWCPPCLEEMPSLQALHEELHGSGLRVVAVSIDDPGSENDIRDFVREQGLTFEILHDAGAGIMTAYAVGGVPQTFLIDRSGRIRYKSFVTDWRTEDNRRLVEDVLAESDARGN